MMFVACQNLFLFSCRLLARRLPQGFSVFYFVYFFLQNINSYRNVSGAKIEKDSGRQQTSCFSMSTDAVLKKEVRCGKCLWRTSSPFTSSTSSYCKPQSSLPFCPLPFCREIPRDTATRHNWPVPLRSVLHSQNHHSATSETSTAQQHRSFHHMRRPHQIFFCSILKE